MEKEVMMPWRKILFLMIISFFISTTGYAQDAGLKIEIQSTLSVIENGQEFVVDTKIKNIGKENQNLQIWSCSYYDNWRVDNPFVELPGWSCDKNFVRAIMLKPEEKYENKLSLKVNIPAKEIHIEKIIFKLGFMNSSDDINDPTKAKEVPTIWSNPMTLQIKDHP